MTVPLNLLIIAATGGLGSTISRLAVCGGHNVSVLVRDASKVPTALGSMEKAITKVYTGDASDPATVTDVLRDGKFDAAVLAVGAQAADTVKNVISSAAAVDPQPVVLTTGGSPALVMADGTTSVAGAFGGAGWAQGLADLHLGTTFAALEASSLARWTMVCPGTMGPSPDGLPHGKHGWRPNVIEPAVAGDTYSYEDVAHAFLAVAADLVAGGQAYNKGKVAMVSPTAASEAAADQNSKADL